MVLSTRSPSALSLGAFALAVILVLVLAVCRFLITHVAVVLIIVLLCGLAHNEWRYVNRATITDEEAATLSVPRIRWILHVEIDRWIHFGSLRFAFRCTTTASLIILALVYFSTSISAYNLTFITGLSSAVLLFTTYHVHKASLRRSTEEERQRLEKFDVIASSEQSGDEWNSPVGEPLFAEYTLHYGAQDYSNADVSNNSSNANKRRRRRNPSRDSDRPDEPPGVQTCYETLGIAPSATKAEIDAAWHTKIKQMHPDLVARLDPDLQALAEKKTKHLNAAREEALRRL